MEVKIGLAILGVVFVALADAPAKLTREEAYMIASIAVDYHVTQVVDGTKGIHGMIPKSIFTLQRAGSSPP